MAQLKDTVISGNLRVTDTIYGHNPHNTYYVKGTQTTATGNWTGELPEVSELYEGLTIDYWLPQAGSGNATLNLTLKGGVTTGPVNCYQQQTARITTHIPQYCICRLTYQTVVMWGTSYTGWWLTRQYDGNDAAVYLFRVGSFTTERVIYRYQFLFQTGYNTLTPLSSADNNTGTSKTFFTDVPFDPLGNIYFWNSTTTIAANGATNAWGGLRHGGLCDMRYTFNCGSTLTLHRALYLKVVPQSDGNVKLASGDPLTYTLPETNDGYFYIFLGRTYSNYQLDLWPSHPVYYHDGTSIREFVRQDLATTSYAGLMSSSDKTKLDGIEAGAGRITTTYDGDNEIIEFIFGAGSNSASYDSETQTLEFIFT